MNMLIDFKKVHNKNLGHMKAFDVTVDHILVHFVGSKLGLYVSFRIPLYLDKPVYKLSTAIISKHVILKLNMLPYT